MTLGVNGQQMPAAGSDGYATIEREWKPGDVVALTLPMPVRRVVAHERVEADRGRVALQRGPIVYAAEWPDNPNGKVRNIVLPASATLTSEFRAELLRGVQVIKGRALGLAYDAQGHITRTEQEFHGHPVRHMGEPRARPDDRVARRRGVEGQADAAPHPGNHRDGHDIARSRTCRRDQRRRRAGIFGRPGVVLRLVAQPWQQRVGRNTRSTSPQRFPGLPSTGSTTPAGGGCVCRPRGACCTRTEGTWKPLDTRDAYGVATDRFNIVTSEPITTTGLRLELTMQPEFSAGIQEWRVE